MSLCCVSHFYCDAECRYDGCRYANFPIFIVILVNIMQYFVTLSFVMLGVLVLLLCSMTLTVMRVVVVSFVMVSDTFLL